MIPRSETRYAAILRKYRLRRRHAREVAEGGGLVLRRGLSSEQRQQILAKTARRCHICGGRIKRNDTWQADHVLAHSVGGGHSIDNYLPAHSLCNHYRWDYSSEEFQEILKLGVWIRTQIERRTKIGRAAGERYLAYARARDKRRKRPREASLGERRSRYEAYKMMIVEREGGEYIR